MTTSVRREIDVEVSQAVAFEVFTEETTAWWPREHHTGSSPAVREVIEPGAGGGWYSLNEDGSESRIGKVLVWEPPRKLVLAWQINGLWQFDSGFVTEVEVNFVALAAERTRVTLEHRNLVRFGSHESAVRSAFEGEGGWSKTLRSFAAFAVSANRSG